MGIIEANPAGQSRYLFGGAVRKPTAIKPHFQIWDYRTSILERRG